MRIAAYILLTNIILLTVSVSAIAQTDIVMADFEGADYGDWKITGTAFGEGPQKGNIGGQRHVSGFQGEGLINSFLGGDTSTGSLSSPSFTIQRDYINFLVGGGHHPGETEIQLIIGGKTVRSTSGPDDEQLRWASWDLKKLKGSKAVIKIIDSYSGRWGHINIDHILQSDTEFILPDLEKAIKVDARYLNLPVKTGAEKRRVKALLDGEIFDEFDIELAKGTPDFHAFVDLEAHQGKTLTLISSNPWESDQDILETAYIGDEIAGADSMYTEKLRPQFHFSPRRGWNNDPNGLVYYDGEYHLYFQHNPYGWNWGNMHWGHAVSSDMVHWEEIAIALNPFEYGDWAYSGSAVIDWKNTSGFKTGDEEVLIAAYTSTGRGESILYSNDRGRTFTEYEGNPVVKHDGRDPKIIWHEESAQWVMAIYDVIDSINHISFHVSDDLKNWKYTSSIEGYYECPEIFPLAVDGDPTNEKWVLYAADSNYAIGTFDGFSFSPEEGKHSGNYGNCFYASQTYSDIPEEDGRRIQVGWGRVATKGMPFNQMMTFPCELTLKTTDEGIRIAYTPVSEIATLHSRHFDYGEVTIRENENPLDGFSGDCYDITAEIEAGTSGSLTFSIRGVDVIYDTVNNELRCMDKVAPLSASDGNTDIRLLIDRTSIEIYAEGGLVYMPMGVEFSDDAPSYSLSAGAGEVKVSKLKVHEVKSAWK